MVLSDIKKQGNRRLIGYQRRDYVERLSFLRSQSRDSKHTLWNLGKCKAHGKTIAYGAKLGNIKCMCLVFVSSLLCLGCLSRWLQSEENFGRRPAASTYWREDHIDRLPNKDRGPGYQLRTPVQEITHCTQLDHSVDVVRRVRRPFLGKMCLVSEDISGFRNGIKMYGSLYQVRHLL